MNFSFARFGRRKLVLLLLLLALAGAVLVLLRPPPPPPIAVMAVPEGFPITKRTLRDRCLGLVPMWGWRLKQAIVGPATSIGIKGTIIALRGPDDAILSEVAGRGVWLAETNGLRAWLMDEADIRTILRRLGSGSGSQVVSSPSVGTSDGVTAVLSASRSVPIQGTATDVGVTLSVLPRVRRVSTDLTTVIVLTEVITNQTITEITNGLAIVNTLSIQTNLATAARIQIPDGSGVFLLEAARGFTNQRCTGVFISATPKRGARKRRRKALKARTAGRTGCPLPPAKHW